MREADGEAGVLVVGVYPSACRVAWTASSCLNWNQPYGHEEKGERRSPGMNHPLASVFEWSRGAGAVARTNCPKLSTDSTDGHTFVDLCVL